MDLPDLPEKYQAKDLLTEVKVEEPQESALTETFGVPRLPRGGIDLKEHLTHLEYTLIKQALDETNWIVAHAAKRLKMGRTTLVEKMRKFEMHRAEAATEN